MQSLGGEKGEKRVKREKKIIVAKTAGFCYGVSNAVSTVERLLDEGRRVYTLGPIIHNAQVTDGLAARGAHIADSVGDAAGKNAVLVIRSHGVPRSVYEEIEGFGIEYVDATCPFVKKIHKIAAEAGERGDVFLLAGDAEHPEVKGIIGHSKGEYHTFNSEEELLLVLEKLRNYGNLSVSAAAQTTFNVDLWKKCVEIIKKRCTNALIFDTICKATQNRQNEAAELAAKCDVVLVIGDKKSSNTKKLCDICSEYCETYRVDNAVGIPASVRGASVVGITAGASAPACIIKEVQETMTEIFAEENFEALLEESFKNSNTNGKVVEGTVVGINPNEVYVDVGRPQTGVVQLEDLTDNPNLTTEQCVKLGDKLSLVIMRTNDQEGLIYLSKRLYDSNGAWDDIKNAAPKIVNRPRRKIDSDEEFVSAEEADAAENAPAEETVEIIEDKGEPVVFSGIVTEVVKGGVVVSYKGVKVFIPAGQATVRRDEPLEGLLKKEVKFIVLEVNPGRHRAVGSIKAVLNKERRAKEKEFWDTIEEGKVFTGTVKSLTNFGAFVDLGVVDGLVHITELSWTRIKHPSEVLKVGDVVEVFVKKIDREKRNISLGYKKTEDNPWEILRVNYPVGTVIEAPVVGTPDFGAFVSILPGIDGLVHISQLSTSRVEKPSDVVAVGDTVRAVITEIDFDRKRVSLSMRKLLEDAAPAEEAAEAEEAEAPAEE